MKQFVWEDRHFRVDDVRIAAYHKGRPAVTEDLCRATQAFLLFCQKLGIDP